MLQVLKVTALVLALISAGVVALGLVVAGVGWLSAKGGAGVAPPAAAKSATPSQATPASGNASPCGVDGEANAPECGAEGAPAAWACDPPPSSSPLSAAPAGLSGVPALDRRIPARTKTATFALG